MYQPGNAAVFGMGVFSLVTTDQIVANIFETTHIQKSYKCT